MSTAPAYLPLKYKSRKLTLHKALVSPNFGEKTVLTNEPWQYVDLALVRGNKPEARFYWQQAREFYAVAQGVSLQSAPLLLYYAYMNAAKALLAVGTPLTANPLYHGIKPIELNNGDRSDAFAVKFRTDGVLPKLSQYYSETERADQHSLQELFLNMPFIHRTYCLTYTLQKEVFIPLRNPVFKFRAGTTDVYFCADLSEHYPIGEYLPLLPRTIADADGRGGLISSGHVTVSSTTSPTQADLQAIAAFAKTLREDIYYINGTEALWYLKARIPACTLLNRQTPTLTLAAMHRLSDICRYSPMKMRDLLNGEDNWLVGEFIKMSGIQFIDEIASEITGMQFLVPNARPAT